MPNPATRSKTAAAPSAGTDCGPVLSPLRVTSGSPVNRPRFLAGTDQTVAAANSSAGAFENFFRGSPDHRSDRTTPEPTGPRSPFRKRRLWSADLLRAGLIVAGFAAATAAADFPNATARWRTCAEVDQPVTHSVMLRDHFSGDLRRRKLVGPEGVLVAAAGDACLCRYAIEPAPPLDTPAGRLRLELPGAAAPLVVTVGPPRAALLPAQLLRDGPPMDDPGTVVFTEHRLLRIESGPDVAAVSVCLPVEYRHHFERLIPGDEAVGFIVHPVAAEPATGSSFGIVDDLGTNRLQLDRSLQPITSVTSVTVVR